MSRETRRGYEFSDRDKREAKRRWHEANPGREDEQLDVDHKVPIFRAREMGMHPHEVNTLQNARAVPRAEHQKRDHNEDVTGFLSGMARFVGRLFD